MKNKEQKYPLQDKLDILRLRSVTYPSKEDMDLIFNLNKKYINPGITTYLVNCKCSNSITNRYWELLKWYNENQNKFE